MSALPPKADMLSVSINVCYVPLADITAISALPPLEQPAAISSNVFPAIPLWVKLPARAALVVGAQAHSLSTRKYALSGPCRAIDCAGATHV